MSSTKSSVTASKKRQPRGESKKTSKRMKDDPSAVRVPKDKAKAVTTARKRKQISDTSMRRRAKGKAKDVRKRESPSTLRSSTLKKQSKRTKKGVATASAAALPSDEMKTDATASTRAKIKKKSKRSMSGASVKRTPKGKAKVDAAARKRLRDSKTTKLSSSMRSPTPKKQSKQSTELGSAVGLPPADHMKTDAAASVRKRRKKKGERVTHSVLAEPKASAKKIPIKDKSLHPSKYIKSVEPQSKSVATAAVLPQTEDVKENDVKEDDVKDDSVARTEPIPFLKFKPGFNGGTGVVDGFLDFMLFSSKSPCLRSATILAEMLPGFVEKFNWHASAKEIIASPQWQFYEALVAKMQEDLGKTLAGVVWELVGSYPLTSFKGGEKIQRLAQSGLPLAQMLEKSGSQVDDLELTPEWVVNVMFSNRWTTRDKILFREIIAPKMEPLLCAVEVVGGSVRVLDAKALATKAQHMVAIDCFKDPRHAHVETPTARTQQIVMDRSLAATSTYKFRKAKAIAEDGDDPIERKRFELLAEERAAEILDMIDNKIKFKSVQYESARLVSERLEPAAIHKLSEDLRSGDPRRVDYATSMAEVCASTKLYVELLKVARQLTAELPAKFTDGFEEEKRGKENQDAYAILCDEHNAWLKHKSKSKLLDKKSAERSQSKYLRPCKRRSFLKSVDMRSAASGSQSAEHIYDMGSYATDLHIEALAVDPYVDDFFSEEFGAIPELFDADLFKGPPKGVERMREKGRKVDPSEAYPTTAEIADAIRFTATFKDCRKYVQGMEAFVKYVCGKRKLTRVGEVCIELVQVKNNFAGRKPTDAIDKYLDVKFIFVVYVLLADGTIHKLVGEMQFMGATMCDFKGPSHELYAITRTSEDALADLHAADDFDICQLHSDAKWLPLLGAGYKPPAEDFEKTLHKAILCEEIGIGAVLRILGWLPTAEAKSAALRKLLESPPLFHKFVEFNGSRHDFVEHLKVFDTYAKEEFEKAKFVRWKTLLSVVRYVSTADRVSCVALDLLWPKYVGPPDAEELLFSEIGSIDFRFNIFHSVACGDAHYERGSECAHFVKERIGQRLLEKADPPPISTYLFRGGRNLSVIRALFSDKQKFYDPKRKNVFHHVAAITRSEAVAKELRRLLGRDRTKQLLRQRFERKRPTQIDKTLLALLRSADDSKAKAAAQ